MLPLAALLDALLDRLEGRLTASGPFPGEFVGPGATSQRSLFNGTATATFTTGPFANPNGRYAVFTLNITAAAGTTPTLVIAIQGLNKDGVAFGLLTATSQTGVAGPITLSVGPGLPVTANVAANAVFPAQYQVVHTLGGTSPSFTYSLDLDLV